MRKAIVAVSGRVDGVVKVFMQISLLTTVLIVLCEVFFRNVLGKPLYWIEEVTVTYLGTWFVFIGASHSMKAGLLVSFEFVKERLGERTGRLVFVGSQLAIALFLLVVVVYGTRLAFMTFEQPSPALQLPMGIAYLGVVVGCALMVLHTGATVIVRLRGPREG